MKSFIKKKAAPALGFRTPDFFKSSRFGSANSKARFARGQFRTQHKGG